MFDGFCAYSFIIALSSYLCPLCSNTIIGEEEAKFYNMASQQG